MTTTPVGLSPATLASNTADAAGKLMHEQGNLAEAKQQLLNAEHKLKDAETMFILEGLEGKNAEQRAADLNNKTEAYRNDVTKYKMAVTRAEAAHATARTQWRMCCELNALAALIDSY
jgi:hypothetical protein